MNRIENVVPGTDRSAREATRGPYATHLRPLLLTASFLLALAAAPAGAVDEHHPETPGSASAGVVSLPQAVGPAVEKMRENVRAMQSQLDRVAAAQTDEERRDALAEHMRTIQQNMLMGRNMMIGAAGDCPMMGGAMMGGGMMGAGMMGGAMMGPGMMGGAVSAGAGPAEMQRMERRLDMMQMMMEQMLQARQPQAGAAPPMPNR